MVWSLGLRLAATVAPVALVAALMVGSASAVEGAVTSATDTASVGAWGPVHVVAGIARLNRSWDGGATTSAISCPTTSWCGAGGTYVDATRHVQAFVVRGGEDATGTAIEVPGLGSLNQGDATLASLSCGAPGDCAAGGSFEGPSQTVVAWLDTEHNGTWGVATTVAESPTGLGAAVTGISCTSATRCTAVGQGQDGTPFVVDEVAGTWTEATAVPGLGALGTAGALTSVSCSVPGDCAAAGWVGTTTSDSNFEVGQIFVVEEAAGTWGDAFEPSGVKALNVGDSVTDPVVSCGAVGSCAIAGTYTDARAAAQVFVASATHGVWSAGEELPGSRSLNGGGWATLAGLSCRGAECTLAAQMADHAGPNSLYVSAPVLSWERAGTWSTAQRLPGEPILSVAIIAGLACWAGGYCTVIGHTSPLTAHSHGIVFTAAQLHGTWVPARPVATTSAFDRLALQSAEVQSLACSGPSVCLAGGLERAVAKQDQEAFLLAETPVPVVTHLSRPSGPSMGGTSVIIYGRHLDATTSVAFGSTPARRFEVLDPDAVRAVAPAGRGAVEVLVTTPGGTSAQLGAARFRYLTSR